MIYFFFSSCLLIFLGKAVADIVSVESHWKTSWFHKKEETSWFGPKNKTSVRKDNMGAWISSHTFLSLKIANYLSHTILVPFTDIWHFANTTRRLGIYLSVFFALQLGELDWQQALIYTVIFAAINQTGFWLLYNYILKKPTIR